MGVVVTVRVMWRGSYFFGRPTWWGGRTAVGRQGSFPGEGGMGPGSSVCLKRASELTAFLPLRALCTGALVNTGGGGSGGGVANAGAQAVASGQGMFW